MEAGPSSFTMTDHEDIHCNVLHCRKALCLETQACVTSCSHIFCIACANRCFNQALVCPACNTALTQNDDIVVTQLNPSEEYKSSILSGLRPDVVMDISSRAIAFYYYQTSQELCYQSIMRQNLENKCSTLQEQLRDAVRESSRAVKAEKQKCTALIREQEQEKRRMHDLQNQLHEKTKQFQKLQLMYEKLKRKQVTPNIQNTLQQPTPVSMNTAAPSFTATDRLRTFPYAPSTRAPSPDYENNQLAPPVQVHARHETYIPYHPPPASARRNLMNQTNARPQQQYYYRDDIVQPPAAAAVRGSAVHHQESSRITRPHQQQRAVNSSNQYRGYATVVSPQPRSVTTSVGRRNPIATPSPRLRPFTNTNRVSIPQQENPYRPPQ
ncbi:hypothetical protein BJV82DRAFT_598819 [Fennellomyces sp. T-0311]|nr:hypothetical protein BJV82DRAFT_598819 [Fennellomyces sp. T-0311]